MSTDLISQYVTFLSLFSICPQSHLAFSNYVAQDAKQRQGNGSHEQLPKHGYRCLMSNFLFNDGSYLSGS